MNESADHARRASISFDEWCQRMRRPGYKYTQSEWYKAGKALELEVHETPPPPRPDVDSWARSWVLMAQDPDKALLYQSHYGIAFTADVAYQRPTPGTVNALRARGQRVRAWCDCIATPPLAAKLMAQDMGMDGWIGQGETSTQFYNALGAGCDLAVVNLSALTDEQQAVIGRGEIKVAVETYMNCNPNLKPDWMNLNKGIVGNCIAVYADAECPGMPFAQYVANGHFNRDSDWIYDPGMTDDERRLA